MHTANPKSHVSKVDYSLIFPPLSLHDNLLYKSLLWFVNKFYGYQIKISFRTQNFLILNIFLSQISCIILHKYLRKESDPHDLPP